MTERLKDAIARVLDSEEPANGQEQLALKTPGQLAFEDAIGRIAERGAGGECSPYETPGVQAVYPLRPLHDVAAERDVKFKDIEDRTRAVIKRARLAVERARSEIARLADDGE